MLSRSKSAHGVRVLGSGHQNINHRETEMEYTLIKSLVEAYSQQCMPASYNKIPVRADKWESLTLDEPRYRLDLARIPLTPTWKSRAQRKRIPGSLGRLCGHHDPVNNFSGKSNFSSQIGRYRPSSPIRNTFQRNSGIQEEKVLPVWTPDLKEGIVFTHRYPSSSSLSNSPASGEGDGMSVSRHSQSKTTMPSRRGLSSSDRLLSRPTSSRQPIKKEIRPRPQTVGDLRRKPICTPPSSAQQEKDYRDTGILVTGEGLGDEEKLTEIERLHKTGRQLQNSMDSTQRKQILSLKIVLPRQESISSLDHPAPLNSSNKSTSTKEDGLNVQPLEKSSQQNFLPLTPNNKINSMDANNDDDNQELQVGPYHVQKSIPDFVSCCRSMGQLGKHRDSSSESECRKGIHCELFGPTLCSDCRLERERIRLEQEQLKLEEERMRLEEARIQLDRERFRIEREQIRVNRERIALQEQESTN